MPPIIVKFVIFQLKFRTHLETQIIRKRHKNNEKKYGKKTQKRWHKLALRHNLLKMAEMSTKLKRNMVVIVTKRLTKANLTNIKNIIVNLIFRQQIWMLCMKKSRISNHF